MRTTSKNGSTKRAATLIRQARKGSMFIVRKRTVKVDTSAARKEAIERFFNLK